MKNKAKKEPYDWAQAILSVASADTKDLGKLAKIARLDPATGDLSDIDLSDLDLSGEDLGGGDLRHAKLTNAKLTQTELRHAKLDVRQLIQASDWENAELDASVRKEAMQLKRTLDAISSLGFNPVLLKRLDELELSIRSANLLKNHNVVYIGDLIHMTEAEFLRVPNSGRKSLNEVKAMLAEIGLHLGMEAQGWPPENIEDLAKQFEDRY